MPVVLAALGAWVCILSGCGKHEGEAKASDPASPESYMKDPVFLAKLDASVKERDSLAATRGALVTQMKAKIVAVQHRLGTTDEKAVKAELEKDPEWKSLYARCEDVNTAIREQSRRTQAVVRERLAPAKPISK